MSDFSADEILSGLKGFQRDAVDHAMRRLYEDADSTRRFLVADETGLGKSVIARGIIARVIEHLQNDDSVDRIDIVYVCSNADLANQNLRRLDVTGNPHLAMSTRLTLLARESARLRNAPIVGRKRVNLVSFTPGTAFNTTGWQTGNAEERALIHVLLAKFHQSSAEKEFASAVFFQGTLGSPQRLIEIAGQLKTQMVEPLDKGLVRQFIESARDDGLIEDYQRKLRKLRGKDSLTRAERWPINDLVGKFRNKLAKASVDVLEPDLIILDEFQRFRHLLDLETGGDAAQLAHDLFEHRDARVLLLSATPYKPFTVAGSDSEDDHYADLFTTLGFLAAGNRETLGRIRTAFTGYHDDVLEGRDATESMGRLRSELTRLMSRTERPQVSIDRAFVVDSNRRVVPDPREFVTFARLDALARATKAPISTEYWKSVPHFANFMQDYTVKKRIDAAIEVADEAVVTSLRAVPAIDRAEVESWTDIDLGNARLGQLSEDTIGADLWKLLWMPPSMPYWAPGGPFASRGAARATKRLVFSSWTAAPTAIASLLSYQADRRIAEGSTRLTANTADARKGLAKRLAWALDEGRPAAMSTLALFWPHPALAQQADPLAFARQQPARVVPTGRVEREVRRDLKHGRSADQAWQAFFSSPGALPAAMSWARARREYARSPEVEEDEPDQDGGRTLGIEGHLDAASRAAGEPESSHPDLALLALHSPANIAFRAVGRILAENDGISDEGQWIASLRLAEGLRRLFNRLETTLLLDQLYLTEDHYWQVILRYCADGNLQAVLDEYLFQLRSEIGVAQLTNQLLLDIADQAAAAMTLRPSTYRAYDPTAPDDDIPFTARFALRYGGRKALDEDARQPEARRAFNSPFWPFVLASTSVGQEGIDFHWWSHAVVHWNLPTNPVDFEQREGRVNRYAGHAIRKNVAAAHREEALSSADRNPWDAAFKAAAHTHDELGEFAPYWLYPGDAKIERQIITYPLSRDIEKAERLRRSLALYRLTLGQPAQQDMLDLLRLRGVEASEVVALDLRPPPARERKQ